VLRFQGCVGFIHFNVNTYTCSHVGNGETSKRVLIQRKSSFSENRDSFAMISCWFWRIFWSEDEDWHCLVKTFKGAGHWSVKAYEDSHVVTNSWHELWQNCHLFKQETYEPLEITSVVTCQHPFPHNSFLIVWLPSCSTLNLSLLLMLCNSRGTHGWAKIFIYTLKYSLINLVWYILWI